MAKAEKTPFSEKEISQIRAMSGFGLTVEQMSSILGISKRTFERRSKYSDGAVDALEKGRAEVTGTNLEGTLQFDMASQFCYGIAKIVGSYDGQSDLIFASEYFEHIERPIEELYKIIRTNRPRYLLVANAFTGIAIGHFNHYKYLNNVMTNKEMSKFFNQKLRELGYEKIKTMVWNNRPSLWVKQTGR